MTIALSYTYQTAADATGYSVDTIRNAVRLGDLEMTYPRVGVNKDGTSKHLSRGVIKHDVLMAWLDAGANERPAA